MQDPIHAYVGMVEGIYYTIKTIPRAEEWAIRMISTWERAGASLCDNLRLEPVCLKWLMSWNFLDYIFLFLEAFR
jgi:hypothetical protein